MKITAIILAIFISFLAGKPGVDLMCSIIIDMEISCCDTRCTPFSANDKSQNQDNDCSGEACNPFQTCNSCVLLINNVASIGPLFKPNPTLKSSFIYQLAFTSQYISDFWQPPKFV